MAVRPHRRATVLGVALLVPLLITGAGCAQVVTGTAVPSQLPAAVAVAAPAPVLASSQSGALAEATAAMLQEFWRTAFPAAFGRDWDEIDTFAAVRIDPPAGRPPPCVDRAADVTDQAYYCPAADAIAWDADGLLPGLYERFGAAGVVVVLAHEVGHAVQTRLGVDAAQAREPQRYPTVLLEAMADCYAGVTLAHLVDQPLAQPPDLPPIGLPERDAAMRALVGFSDPLGVDAADRNAHGNAFDRVSAFQDGYRDGATRCAAMSVDNREFTQRRFGSEGDRARGGDLPLPQLLSAVEDDAGDWFGRVAPGGRVPRVEPATSCPGRAAVAQGPAAYCVASGEVTVDQDALAGLHRDLGDFAGATLVASRYGVGVLDATGRATTGPAAGAAATCLAGAYTARLVAPADPGAAGGFQLSPGDLDEAVEVLLVGDWAARDSAGEVDPADHGFERVARFRTGLTGGPDACLR